MRNRSISLSRPLSLNLTLGPLCRGSLDPCMRFDGPYMWRATRTPQGPATLRLHLLDQELHGRAWGDGADWLLGSLESLISEHQDEASFLTDNPLVNELHRSLVGLRLPRVGAVFETILPFVVEQRVTAREARSSYRAIVKRWSEPAPGPYEAHQLMLPPDPKALASLPYYVFHPMGIERKRAETIVRVAKYATKLEAITYMNFEDAARRLQLIDGIGPWTTGHVMQLSMGDPDAIVVGDFHIPNWIGWVLAREARATDERMCELLEPFVGHRGLVQRLICSGAAGAPKFGPRYSPLPIASM